MASRTAGTPALIGDSRLGRHLRAGLHRLQGAAAAFQHRLRSRSAQRRGLDTHQPRHRRRRWIIGVLIALLAYPVLGTLALWTGLVESLLKSEDLRVEIDNPAYTIWPGRIHMKRVKILVNGGTQFTLEGHNLVLDVRVIPLLKRRVHVTELAARDVRYRMRVQVESEQGIKERLAAYPPLTELPGAKVIREQDAAQTEPRGKPWTVQVDGIDISVAELWFMEYRYVGDGTLRGGFLVAPDLMRVGTSVQDIGPGQLRFGPDHVIANGLRGRIEASIPDVNPNAHPGTRFLDFVTAHLTLKAQIESLQHLSAYIEGVDVDAGKGALTADIGLAKGKLGNKSELRYETEKIRLMGHGFGVQSDWLLDARVTGDAGSELPRVSAGAKSTYVSLSRGDREFTIQVHGHKHEAVLQSTQIGSQMALKHARIHMPTVVSRDFDDFGAALSKDAPLRTQRGSLQASLTLDVDERHVARGPFKASLDKARLVVAGVQLGADARARADIELDLKQKRAVLKDVNLAIADGLMHVGDEHVEGWWMNVSSKRISASQGPPLRYDATIALRAKDAEPILESLAEKDKLNDLIAKFTSLDDLRATVTVRGASGATDVMISSFESDVWDVSGRVYSKGEQTRVALVVGGQAVSVGIATDGKNTEIQPFAKTDWLNERLRQFPKPVQQVAPSKP